jgi:hypothetical protein
MMTLFSAVAHAADRMIGIVPSDGIGMLAKRFDLSAGTVVTGVRFETNDPSTPFAKIVLVHGDVDAVSRGVVVACTTGVVETVDGVAAVAWNIPTRVEAGGTYWVGICPPAGPGKQGPGRGPAVGATGDGSSGTSYVTYGSEETLLPISVDLAIALDTAAASGGPGVLKGSVDEGRPDGLHPNGTAPGLVVAPEPDGVTRIHVTLWRDSEFALEVLDVRGRRLRTLARGPASAGDHLFLWDSRDDRGVRAGRGIYFVRARGPEGSSMRKLVLGQ